MSNSPITKTEPQLFVSEATESIKILYLSYGLCVRINFNGGVNRNDELTILTSLHHGILESSCLFFFFVLSSHDNTKLILAKAFGTHGKNPCATFPSRIPKSIDAQGLGWGLFERGMGEVPEYRYPNTIQVCMAVVPGLKNSQT